MARASSQAEGSHPNQGFIARAHRVLIVFGCIYAAIIVLLAIPFFQLHAVYLHAVKWPLFARFDQPEKYGLAPGKTLNLQLTTSDNVTLGAWFILADPFYHSLPAPPTAKSLPELVAPALASHPTIIFLHGNAATRAVPFRVALAAAYSSRLQANVLALDYRGFADSTGTPSERGLTRDARAAWNWLAAGGARAEDVLVVGHSLGTAVGAALAHELEVEGVRPRGLALLAPFSTLRTLLDTYYVLGLFPLMKPLELIPGARTALKWFLAHEFDTLAIINNITTPLLLAHAEDDWEIPPTHSAALFDARVAPHLPALPAAPPGGIDAEAQQAFADFQAALMMRQAKRDALVGVRELDGLGSVEEFGGAALVRARWGGHNYVGLQEGVQDVIGEWFHM